MEKGRVVVVLPGSAWQVPLVKRLKENGHTVLVVDPHEDAPACSLADGHLKSDIFDIRAVEAFCRAMGAEALMTDECDIAMPAVARMCKDLSLNGLDETSARLFTDKFTMREFCRSHGIAHPEYESCRTVEDANAFLREIGGPIVLKPFDSNSSRGVHIISKHDEIARAFEDAASYSKVNCGVLAERFIQGREFTVDGVKSPNTHCSLAISKKRHFEHNMSIASELYFAHTDDTYDYQALRLANDRLMQLSPLEFGLTHAEYKYENGEYYLIEAAARGGGNLISSHIVPFISGFDNYQYLIDASLNGPSSLHFEFNSEHMGRCAVLKFLNCPSGGGIVEEIRNASLLDEIPEIAAFRFNFKQGDTIANAVNDAARLGFYIALCENEARLKEIMKTINERINIVLLSV